RRDSPWHHARADGVRRDPALGAPQGGIRYAGRSRGRAQEGGPTQGSPRHAVLQTLIGCGRSVFGGSSSGRTTVSDTVYLGSNPSPPAKQGPPRWALLFRAVGAHAEYSDRLLTPRRDGLHALVARHQQYVRASMGEQSDRDHSRNLIDGILHGG